MNVNDLHLVRSAEVNACTVTAGTVTQPLVEIAFICQHRAVQKALPKAYLSPEAARTVALQLLEVADRAEGRDHTRPVN